jgi:hypothetical protein
MSLNELHAVRRFWKIRQESGKPCFRFKNVLLKHQREEHMSSRKGKGKAPAIKVEEDIDDIYADVEEPSDLIAEAIALSKQATSGKVGESSR